MMLLGNWEHWLNRVQEYIYPSDYKPEYSSILVPNVDNVRTSFLMETIAKQNKVRALFQVLGLGNSTAQHSTAQHSTAAVFIGLRRQVQVKCAPFYARIK